MIHLFKKLSLISCIYLFIFGFSTTTKKASIFKTFKTHTLGIQKEALAKSSQKGKKKEGPRKFVMDPSHSIIEFSVKHLGVVPVKGQFRHFEGQFHYDAASNQVTHVLIKIDLDSVDTNEEDRDAHLRSKDFFNVRDSTYDLIEKNRYMVFQSKKISIPKRKIKKNEWFKIKGKLSLNHVHKILPLQIRAQLIFNQGETSKIAVEVKGKLNRKDFGLTWDKPSTGKLKKLAGKFVGDWVSISSTSLANATNLKAQP